VLAARLDRFRPTRHAAWVAPALLAAAVTAYLAWGAVESAHNPAWLSQGPQWWREWLRPGNIGAPLVFAAAWLTALCCYWWPRRLKTQVVGLTVAAAMVLIGGVLASAALTPCRGGQTPGAVAGWVLDLYVGNPPSFPVGGCRLPAPLAFQLGSPVCLLATLTGALTAAAVLWRQPLDRLRARFVRDATIFTGLDAMTLPLLQQLVAAGRPASIVVVEPDGSHPLLEEARATGAHVMIGPPTSRRVLLPVIAGRRGCALRRLYAVHEDVAQNEAVLSAVEIILHRYQPDPDRQPHLIARIDDPRHADHWRGRHAGRSDRWFEDALSAPESTACGLVDQVFRTGVRQLLLCGDSTLALAILRELARRAWEQRQLADAARAGRAGSTGPGHTSPSPPERSVARPPQLATLPVHRVILLDRRAEDLRREYLATSPPSMAAALPGVRAEPTPWQDGLLAMLDAMTAADAAETTIVVADTLGERGRHEAGRVARLHPGVPVFVLAPGGAGTAGTAAAAGTAGAGTTGAAGASGASGAIFDQLQPVQRALLVDGQVPEDTWTRVARHWHECYRLAHPPAPGDPRALTRRPWAELDEFIRQDNILELRSIMTLVVARGRHWVPSRSVAAGSFIELTGQDLEAVACAEHARWYRRRLAAGWSAGDGRDARRRGGPRRRTPAVDGLVNSLMVPWAELRASQRQASTESLRAQLAQLEDIGFMPVVPAGGPAGAAEFHRVGTVRARRLQAREPWTRGSGDRLHGDAGDWRVVDDSGDERTVRDPAFRNSHQLLGGDVWRRTGSYRAWQVTEPLTLRTMEGRAVARPGDWVVEGCRGERWPVSNAQFRRSYVPTAPAQETAGS